MCGIAGILDRTGRLVEEDRVRAMTAVLAHRGPDDAGLWVDGPVGFGHQRLSIRDLSPAGHQPMTDASGRVTVTAPRATCRTRHDAARGAPAGSGTTGSNAPSLARASASASHRQRAVRGSTRARSPARSRATAARSLSSR